MRIGIHQPNFVPHFGFFYKMSMCDTFVLLNQVQFEKEGFQHRYLLNLKKRPDGSKWWVTMPVSRGLDPIYDKFYTNGENLSELNTDFIMWATRVLGIKTRIVDDVVTDSSSTRRLLDNLNHYGATAYVTNPGAKDKYLDEDMIKNAGIEIIYCSHPESNLNILEMFEKYGIDGTRKQLWKQKVLVPDQDNECDN